MYVKDYDFITSGIDELFEREIVIYGAKMLGRKMALRLEEADLKISCFCDRNKNLNSYMGYAVITIDELRDKTQKKPCMVIVASMRYCNEIIADLKKKEIAGYVCTWYGLQLGMELNIEDERFPVEFRRSVRERKNLYYSLKSTFNYQCNSFEELHRHPDALLVYQPAKVGSYTIFSTLLKEEIEAVHVHSIAENYCIGTAIEGMVNRQISYFKKKYAGGGKNQKLKIITLVREPVARALSCFMQDFREDLILVPVSSDLKKCAKEYVMQQLDDDYEFKWFDTELKELTGIDIYDYPFDKEKGYVWIKEENVEILALKMEKMDENENIVGEFAGRPDLKYVNANIGDDKHYQYIYQELKHHFSIRPEILRSYYDKNEGFRHFYSEDEIEAFCSRWASRCY